MLNKKIYFLPLFIFSLVVVTYSCSKYNELKKENGQFNDQDGIFFKQYPSSDISVIAITDNIKRQSQERGGLVEKIISNAGIPYWSAAKTVSKGSTNASSNNIVENSTQINAGNENKIDEKIIIIPLAKKDANTTNAAIVAKIKNNGDTTFNLIYSAAYKNYTFDTSKLPVLQAYDLFHLFLSLDKQVFGNTAFRVKDTRLIKQAKTKRANDTRPYFIKIRGENEQNAVNELRYVQVCEIYDVCQGPYEENCGGCTENCPDWLYWEQVCFYKTVDVPDFNNSGTGGGTCTTCGGNTNGNGNLNRGNWEDQNCDDPNTPENECINLGWEPADIFFMDYENQGYVHLERPEVSYYDNVVINVWSLRNIDKSKLDTCKAKLLNQVIKTTNNTIIGKILAKIDRSIFKPNNIEKFKVEFDVKPLPGNGRTLNQTYDPVTKIYSATILIDSTMAANSTDIYVAGTMIHELIHAYMSSLLLRVRGGLTIDSLKKMSYAAVFNEYVDTLVAANKNRLIQMGKDKQYDHNYMVNKLLNSIAEALKQFDGNSIGNDRFYWFLSWKGLFETKTWNYHWPNYPNWPISGAPLTTDDSTRGLKYALTPLRFDTLINTLRNERLANAQCQGRTPKSTGCY